MQGFRNLRGGNQLLRVAQHKKPYLQRRRPIQAVALACLDGNHPIAANANHAAVAFGLFRQGKSPSVAVPDGFDEAIFFKGVDCVLDFHVRPAVARRHAEELAHIGQRAAIGQMAVCKHGDERQQLELQLFDAEPVPFKLYFFMRFFHFAFAPGLEYNCE